MSSWFRLWCGNDTWMYTFKTVGDDAVMFTSKFITLTFWEANDARRQLHFLCLECFPSIYP